MQHHQGYPIMKPTFSPESTRQLQEAIDVLERVYRAEMGCESNYLMGKLSTAIGDAMFVMQATSTTPVPVVAMEREAAVS